MFITLMFLPFTTAFGVTSAYWNTNPLQLHPGEERIIDLELQNMAGGDDVEVLAKVTEGTDIASLLGETNRFLVPFGRKDVIAKVLVKLPADAVPGETRNFAVSFTQVADDNEGKMIQMVSGVGKKIPVLVISDELSGAQVATGFFEISSLSSIAIITLIIAAAVLLGFILLRKRNAA